MDEYQGKRKEQVEFSEKMVAFSLIGFILCFMLAFVMYIIELVV